MPTRQTSPHLLFFASDLQSHNVEFNEADTTVSWQFWRPSLTNVLPPGQAVWPFVIWWGLHMLRVFQSAEYCVLLCFQNGLLAHRSCVFPRFYRSPFMGANDLQVGDVWTAPESRNQGLARLALAKTIAHYSGRTVWYVCEDSNGASIRVARKAGLRLHAVGTRTRRLGLRLLGQFRIVSLVEPERSPKSSP